MIIALYSHTTENILLLPLYGYYDNFHIGLKISLFSSTTDFYQNIHKSKYTHTTGNIPVSHNNDNI